MRHEHGVAGVIATYSLARLKWRDNLLSGF